MRIIFYLLAGSSESREGQKGSELAIMSSSCGALSVCHQKAPSCLHLSGGDGFASGPVIIRHYGAFNFPFHSKNFKFWFIIL
jgi:hypothetical protein